MNGYINQWTDSKLNGPGEEGFAIKVSSLLASLPHTHKSQWAGAREVAQWVERLL